ncbi:hypothetical protein HDU87_002874 [Geranomyces variabilis]|uniref:F-box domain-containing protein n=1 Tax=Geranomyces variabilis TaxID=109894 RepID=A0AAD5TND8_9FUNG|nr:hypothetical protein HDU87_002874 [Geranomyces variabilis]
MTLSKNKLYQSIPDLPSPVYEKKLGTANAATGAGNNTNNSPSSSSSSSSAPRLAALPKPALATIFQFVKQPKALVSTCRTLHALSRDEHVCARWILARAGLAAATATATPVVVVDVLPAQVFAIIKAGVTARVLSMEVLAVLDRWVGKIRSIDVFRDGGDRAARDWDGWQKMDVAIARCGNAKVVEWCAERGFVTRWDRAIEVAVGAGEMDSAVALLGKWTDAVGVANAAAAAAPAGETPGSTNRAEGENDMLTTGTLKRASSQATIVPGTPKEIPPPTPYRAQTAIRPARITVHPALLTHLLNTDNLSAFLALIPSLPQPLPASTLPALLHSPRILAHIIAVGLLPLDSLLLTLAKSPASTRALALRNLTLHSNAIEGNIAKSSAAGMLLARAALEGDVDTCEWLVLAGVPVSEKAVRNAKDAGEKAVLKLLKKPRK